MELRRKFITIMDNIYSGSVGALQYSMQKKKAKNENKRETDSLITSVLVLDLAGRQSFNLKNR